MIFFPLSWVFCPPLVFSEEMRLNSLNRDMFKPVRSHSGLLGWILVVCLRICTCFKGVSFRETHLWEHFGRTDKIALITCLKNLNVSGAFLNCGRNDSIKRALLLKPLEASDVCTLDGQNRQSPMASFQRTRSTLASHSAIPYGTNVKRMNTDRAIRIAAQRTQGLWGLISVFSREIWLPTKASDFNRSNNSRKRFCDNYRAISPI